MHGKVLWCSDRAARFDFSKQRYKARKSWIVRTEMCFFAEFFEKKIDNAPKCVEWHNLIEAFTLEKIT